MNVSYSIAKGCKRPGCEMVKSLVTSRQTGVHLQPRWNLEECGCEDTPRKKHEEKCFKRKTKGKSALYYDFKMYKSLKILIFLCILNENENKGQKSARVLCKIQIAK